MTPQSLPWRAETRHILRLAWPVALVSLNWTLLQVTDVIMVGQAGTHEVAGFGASRAILYVSIMAAIGWLSGVLVFAARGDGARDLRATGEVFREGLVLASAIGLAGAVILWCGAMPLLEWLGVAAPVRPVAAAVTKMMAFAFPPQLLLIAASNFLEGISRPRQVMLVNLAMLPANALLAWLLVGGHGGFPALGAVGAALATVITVWGGAIAMIITAHRVPDRDARGTDDLSWSALRRAFPGAWRLARFGAVPALASALELTGFSLLIALSTQLGDTVAHSFQIVFAVHNVTFGLALGLGSAAGVRAGNAVGEGQPRAALQRTMIAAALALALLGALALLTGGFAGLVVNGFPATAAVHALATSMLIGWVPFLLFDGLQVVFMFALRALGDQICAGVNAILAFFVITGGSGILLVAAGYGPQALVWASGLGMVSAALLNGARLIWLTAPRRLRSSD